MSVPSSVTELIQGSGNNFHAKVARWFHGNGWHTVVSPYYMDQTQSKARELDLIVEKPWPIKNVFGEPEGDVLVRLFVECKFVASESVFWFAPKNQAAAANLVCSLGPFRPENTYTFKHHYLARSPSVAKLFASNNSRTQENEPFFKALNQALNATVAMKSKSPAHPSMQNRRWGTVVTLNYPVVICSSFADLYAADFLNDSEPAPILENFQMEVQYAFLDNAGNRRDDYFLLDFVEFDQLPAYESDLAAGAGAAAFLARG